MKLIEEDEKTGNCYNGEGKINNEKLTYEGFFYNYEFNGQGKIFYKETNDEYIGEFKNGLKHGNGIYKKYLSGNYNGNFKNDLKDGHGEEEFSNGYTYKGEYKDDKFNGKGELKKTINYIVNNFPESGNYSYKGDFKNGLKHGFGIENYPKDNAKYEGKFIKGYKEGYGEWNNKYVSFYGMWQKGSKNGLGIEYSTDIDNYIYDGYFLNNLKNGIGKLIDNDQNMYMGNFILDKKEGLFLLKNEKLNLTKLLFFKDNIEIKKNLDINYQHLNNFFDYYYDLYLSLNNSQEYFIDKEFKLEIKKDEVYFLNVKILNKKNINFEKIKQMNLKVISENIFINYKIDLYINKFELGKLHDKIFLTFIWSLFLDSYNIEKIIDDISIHNRGFYVFKLYFEINNFIQQYRISIDDKILGSEDFNFFSQFSNNRKNIILTLLEKLWIKYVYINNQINENKQIKKNNDMLIHLFKAFNGSYYIKYDRNDNLNKSFKNIEKYNKLNKKIYFFISKEFSENFYKIPIYLLKIVKYKNEDAYLFYCIENKYKLKIKNIINYENIIFEINDPIIEKIKETDKKIIIIEKNELKNIFYNIYIDLYEKDKFYYNLHILKKNDLLNQFFEFKYTFNINYRNKLNIILEQKSKIKDKLIESGFDEKNLPIRIIIAKNDLDKKNNKIYGYFYGIGQINDKIIYINDLDFSFGEYVLIIQVENIKNIEFNFEFNLQIESNYLPIIFKEIIDNEKENILKLIYFYLCKKMGKKTILKKDNKELDLFNYQYFNKDDNTYIQILNNKSLFYIWKQNINFELENMILIDMNFHANKPLKLNIDIGEKKIIIIQQKECKSFKFSGGKGAYRIININLNKKI